MYISNTHIFTLQLVVILSTYMYLFTFTPSIYSSTCGQPIHPFSLIHPSFHASIVSSIHLPILSSVLHPFIHEHINLPLLLHMQNPTLDIKYIKNGIHILSLQLYFNLSITNHSPSLWSAINLVTGSYNNCLKSYCKR